MTRKTKMSKFKEALKKAKGIAPAKKGENKVPPKGKKFSDVAKKNLGKGKPSNAKEGFKGALKRAKKK